MTIIGSKLPKSWLFWSECSRYDVDSGCWEMHSTEPVLDMLKLLPDWWPHCYPIAIHPEFIPWFRMNYEITVENDWERFGDSPSRDNWMRIIYGDCSNSEHINPPYRNNSLRRNKNIFFRLFLLKNSRLFIKFTFKWCAPMKKSQDT